MSSKLDIFNSIMGLLGIVNPPSLSDVKANEVVVFNREYDRSVDLALSVRTWFFTETNGQIDPGWREDNDNDSLWKYKFLEPDGILALKGVYSTDRMDGRSIPYEYHDKYIYTNSDKCFVSYTKRPVEEDMPEWFVDYLIYLIARRICISLTGDTDLLQILRGQEMEAMKSALSADICRQPQHDLPTDAIIGARL